MTIFPKKFTQGSVQIGIQTHSNCRQNKNNSRILKYLGILSSKYYFPNHKPFAQTISKKIQNWIFLLFQTACLEATSMDKNSWDTPPPPHIQKNMFHWMHEFFNLQFSHFQLLSPFEVVTMWPCPQSAFQLWKGEEGGLAINNKEFFFQLWKIPKERDCFAQMCQNFCPWL